MPSGLQVIGHKWESYLDLLQADYSEWYVLNCYLQCNSAAAGLFTSAAPADEAAACLLALTTGMHVLLTQPPCNSAAKPWTRLVSAGTAVAAC